MNRLPLELACLIFERLEELDLAPTPYSELTEESTAPLVLAVEGKEIRGSCWIELTHKSHADILNARLASSVFYNASHKIFAKLLADRPFRVTNVGFEDLTLVSRKKALSQHVKTLTFGCATFRSNISVEVGERERVQAHSFLEGLQLQDRLRLARAYVQCSHWQHNNLKLHARNLASILQAFPKLDSLRILNEDHVFHLGGWLKPGDEELIHKDYYLHHDRSPEALRQSYPSASRSRIYNNSSPQARECILEAIDLSDLPLRDFRAAPRPPVYDGLLKARFFVPTLRTLRIMLSDHWIRHFDVLQWSSLLSQLTGLQDLSLGTDALQLDGRIARRSNGGTVRVRIHRQPHDAVLHALQDHKHLRRIEFFGGWTFRESAFVNFVADHTDTLRCLILSELLLYGTWRSALTDIARTTNGKAEFLLVRSSEEVPSAAEMPKPARDVDEEQVRHSFSFPTVWIAKTQLRESLVHLFERD